MNKRGFTLVELLAVIAILAILVIIALPNVMGMFNQAKKNSFTTEIKEVYKVASQKWMSDSMFNTSDKSYARGCGNELDLSGREELNYFIKINKAGKIVEFYATDGTYQYKYTGGDLKIEDIKDVQEIAGMSESEQLTLSCAGLATPTEVTYFEYYYNDYEGGITISSYSADGPKDVVIPSTIDGKPVVSLDDNSFADLGLNSVVLPNTLKHIHGYDSMGVFYNNNLTSIILPEGLLTIGDGAFSNNKLTSIVLPSTLQDISWGTFTNNKLKSVTINGSTNIQYNSFAYNEIEQINYGPSASNITIGECAFCHNKFKTVIIPDKVTGLGETAFGYNEVKTVSIPNSITYIRRPFYQNQVESLTIDMTTIPSQSFSTINGNDGGYLKTLVLGEHVQTIQSSAFSGNQLTSVTIPSSVKVIETSAFHRNPLRSVTIKGKSSASDFTTYRYTIGLTDYTPFEWADDVTCVKDNDTNVTNGCIKWEP